MTRSVALAVLMLLLTPLHAGASPFPRVELALAERSDSSTVSEEIVAAIVEGSIRGSGLTMRDSLDVEAAYTPVTGSRAASPVNRPTSRSGRSSSPAAASAAPRTESAGDAAARTSSAQTLEAPDADQRVGSDSAGRSFVGFWLLIVASAAGALLFIGAGRRVRPSARRR